MKYMALIYTAPASEPRYGTPEFQKMMEGYFAVSHKLKEDGAWIAGEGLKGVETATTVRVRSGRTETMDGPHAETREHLGGFYLFDAPDLDSALAYAAAIPGAAYGAVELRPVMDY
jgi:hypothetical protein